MFVLAVLAATGGPWSLKAVVAPGPRVTKQMPLRGADPVVALTAEELAWYPHGPAVAMESLHGRVQAYVRHPEHGWPELELRVAERVLYRSREADYESHHVVPYGTGEALLVERIQGPPGSCVWNRSAIILTVSSLGDMATEQHEVPLGDFLYGPSCPMACGCGQWEASWRVVSRGRATYFETTPVSTGHGEWLDLAGLDLPTPVRLRLR